MRITNQTEFLKSLDAKGVEELHRDAAVYQECVEEALRSVTHNELGFFGPASVAWRMMRELVILAGGLRAVMFQIAHPALAAAGMGHSALRSDFLGRAWRTFSSMSEIIFGDVDTALRASKRIHILHSRVRGVISREISPRHAGARYRGSDPESGLWVLATLYEAAIVACRNLLEPLSRAEEEAYYEEIKRLGLLMGIPLAQMPETLDDFWRYWQEMLEGDALEVGDAARTLASYIFDSPWTGLTKIDDIWASGITPKGWSEPLGLPWSRSDALKFRTMQAAIRAVVPRLPPLLRFCPAYHQATLRVAQHADQPAPYASHLINYLDSKVDLPISLKPIPLPEGPLRAFLEDLWQRGPR